MCHYECSNCYKELDYIRTYSVIEEYDNKRLLETCWFCWDCCLEHVIYIEVENKNDTHKEAEEVKMFSCDAEDMS